jgi:hypothetical protein
MKKLCKLFWNNDALGKWILYDGETNKVLSVKKFDKSGKEIHLNLLEQKMLDDGSLLLDGSIGIWEVELQISDLAEYPSVPTPFFPATPYPDYFPPTHTGTGPMPFYFSSSSLAISYLVTTKDTSGNISNTYRRSDSEMEQEEISEISN